MGRTSITVRMDEADKETFTGIAEAMDESVQEIITRFIEKVNKKYRIVSEASPEEIERLAEDLVNNLVSKDLVKIGDGSSEVPLESKIALISWIVEQNARNSSDIFKESLQTLEENYEAVPDKQGVFLSAAQLYMLSHTGLRETMDLELEEVISHDKVPYSVVVRFMMRIAAMMLEGSPKKAVENATKEAYGKKQNIILEDQTIETKTSPNRSNEIRMEMKMPFRGEKEES